MTYTFSFNNIHVPELHTIYHYIYIYMLNPISLKDSENLEKSLHVRGKAKKNLRRRCIKNIGKLLFVNIVCLCIYKCKKKMKKSCLV